MTLYDKDGKIEGYPHVDLYMLLRKREDEASRIEEEAARQLRDKDFRRQLEAHRKMNVGGEPFDWTAFRRDRIVEAWNKLFAQNIENGFAPESLASEAVEFADALIAELKMQQIR